MPTREETARAEPVVKQMLASERAALASGKKTQSEVADAALKLASEADTEAAKLLLMKGACVLYVKDGKVEKAAQTMNAIEKAIADLPPKSVTNMIDLALLGLQKKDGERLYQALETAKSAPSDVKWNYEVKNGEIILGGDGRTAVPTAMKGDLVIPATIDGKPVRKIGDHAFEGCRALTSVTIPEGVTNVGMTAFGGCQFKSIGLPPGIKNIEAQSFWFTPLESVTIPEGVTNIDNNAFHRCEGLKSVAIPSTVKSIRSQAFWCAGLESLTLPAGVTFIGHGAFHGCEALTKVTMLGERPNAPDNDAFNECPKLTEIHVPANAKSWAGMTEWQGKKLVFDAKEK